MLNIKTLTDTMSRMELPQLQQYATLHKNDPYIVTLALSIANQKKQMKAGQAGQAGMMPQPKVADQQIAQMSAPQQEAPTVDAMGNVTGYAGGGYLPEDSGIGTLPAPNMQNFAGGGIVAFDEGGSTSPVGRFFSELTAQTPEQTRQAYVRNALMRKKTELTEQGGIFGLKQQTPQQKEIYNRTKAEIDYLENLARNPNYTPVAATSAAPPAPAAAPAAAPALPPNATQVMSGLPAAVVAKPPAAAKPPVADVAKPPTTPVDPLAGLPSLKTTAISADQAKRDAATLSDDTELRNALTANEGFVKGAYDKLLGDYDRKVTEMPEAYKGYEARLKKEEDAASTDKDKALGMSIFRAGLGMLAGTSQYAFENIGKGALTGLEDYQSALKDLKKAQRERDKAFADIEQARLAEKRGDLKTHTELQAKGIEALGSAKNRTVDGIAKIFDVNTRTATGIFETGMKDLAQNQRTIYTAAVDFKKQDISDAAAAQRQRDMDAAAMQRTNAQVAGSLAATRMSVDAFKLPTLYKSVEDSVDKMLQADINYKTADEVTKTAMRNAALKKRLLATPGLAQYADATTGGGSAPGLRYNPQTGKIE